MIKTRALASELMHDRGSILPSRRFEWTVVGLSTWLMAGAYLDAWAGIKQTGLSADTSLKLTQFGLDLSTETCVRLVARLAGEARQREAEHAQMEAEAAVYIAKHKPAKAKVLSSLRWMKYGCFGALAPCHS